MGLAAHLETAKTLKAVEKLIQDPEFSQLDSDTRFVRVFSVVSAPEGKASKPQVREWQHSSEKVAATITRSARGVNIFFDAKKNSGFSDFIERKFDELYAEFQAQSADG